MIGTGKDQDSHLFFSAKVANPDPIAASKPCKDDTQPSNEFRLIAGERPTFDCLKDQADAQYSKRSILRNKKQEGVNREEEDLRFCSPVRAINPNARSYDIHSASIERIYSPLMHKEICGPNATPVFALEELETSRIREKTDPENSPVFSTLKKNVSQLSLEVVLSNR